MGLGEFSEIFWFDFIEFEKFKELEVRGYNYFICSVIRSLYL